MKVSYINIYLVFILISIYNCIYTNSRLVAEVAETRKHNSDDECSDLGWRCMVVGDRKSSTPPASLPGRTAVNSSYARSN